MFLKSRASCMAALFLFLTIAFICLPCSGREAAVDGAGGYPSVPAEQVPADVRLKKIVLDPGHGGTDSGAVGYSNMMEKDINLTLALALEARLKSLYCCEIMLTRREDVYVLLGDRSSMANEWGADFYFSLHSNASPAGASKGLVRGYEDFIYNGEVTPEEIEIRRVIHPYISKVWVDAGSVNRGMKRDDFHVLRETNMPAMLVENGFVDNVQDVGLLKDPSFRDKLVEAMADGIAAALKLPGAVAVSRVSIDGEILYFSEDGGNVDLEATVYPANAFYGELIWSSDCPAVAVVNETGQVEAVGEGEVFIWVTVDAGPFTDKCGVVVGLEIKRGDLDADGQIDVHDAISVLKHVVGNVDLQPSQLYAGDLNGDRYVNIRDAIVLLRHIVGLELIPDEIG